MNSSAPASSRPIQSAATAISRIMQGESFESIKPRIVFGEGERPASWHCMVCGASIALAFVFVKESVCTEMDKLAAFLLAEATNGD